MKHSILTAFLLSTLLPLASARANSGCDIGTCEFILSEPNRPNCTSGSVPRAGHLYGLRVNENVLKVWTCNGAADCEYYREALLRRNGCKE